MFKLIGNENVKIYRRSRTWIMMGLLILAIVVMAVVIFNQQKVAPGNWQQALITQTTQVQQQIQHAPPHMSVQKIAQLKSQVLINQYDLSHNINPGQTTGWGFATTAQSLSSLLIAFLLVVAGDIVAGEFSTGTIKMLLTQTATRTQILSAKYISMLLFSLFSTAVMIVFSVLVGWAFFGTAGAGAPHVYVDTHQVVQQTSVISYLMMQYGFLLVKIVVVATMAFMISTIFRSSALAIVISLLTFLLGGHVMQELSKYSWAKYILLANTDLSQFVVNGPVIPGLTLGFSITMLVAYFIVMIGLACRSFVKRDVAFT